MRIDGAGSATLETVNRTPNYTRANALRYCAERDYRTHSDALSYTIDPVDTQIIQIQTNMLHVFARYEKGFGLSNAAPGCGPSNLDDS